MPDITRLRVRGPDGREQVLKGTLEHLPGIPGISSEIAVRSLDAQADPLNDYFFIESKDGETLLFTTDASNFSLAGRKIEDFTFSLPTPIKKVHEIIDHSGEITISKLSVEIGSTDRPLPHERLLKSRLEKSLKKELVGKSLTGEELKPILALAGPLLTSLSLSFGARFKKETNGEYSLIITVVGAPLVIDLSGLPADLREEVRPFLQRCLTEEIIKHPFAQDWQLGRLGTTAEVALQAVPAHSGDIAGWRYPDRELPQSTTDLLPLAERFLTGRGRFPDEWIPPIPRNGRIPISGVVLGKLDLFLRKHLAEKPGRFKLTLDKTQRRGTVRLEIEQKPFFNIFISSRGLRWLQSTRGIDLSREAEELSRGTSKWSVKKWKEFLARVQEKYRAAGLELLEDHPQLLIDDGRGRFALNVALSVPLLSRESVQLVIDTSGEGLIDAEKAKEILFTNRPSLTRREVHAGVGALAVSVSKADYLIESAYPDDRESGFILAKETDSGIELTVRIAKRGELIIKNPGEMPEASIDALREALRWEPGTPFRPKAFRRCLARVLSRLDLKREGEVVYSYSEDGRINAEITITRPKGEAMFGAGLGTSGGFEVQGQVSLPHVIRGTSRFSSGIVVGSYGQGLNVSTTTVPFTDSGVRLSIGAGAARGSYPNSEVEYQRVSGGAAFIIPLGGEGIASPWHLRVPIRASFFNRADGGNEEQTIYTGTGLSLSYHQSEIIFTDDFLKFSVDQDYDVDARSGRSDTTTRARVVYTNPIFDGFLVLEGSLYAYHRQFIGETSSARVLSNEIPPIDFAIGSVPTPYSTNITGGLMLKKPLGEIITPFAGLTISYRCEIEDLETLDPVGRQRAALGVGVELPFLGNAAVYVGYPVMEDGRIMAPDISKPTVGFQLNWTYTW